MQFLFPLKWIADLIKHISGYLLLNRLTLYVQSFYFEDIDDCAITPCQNGGTCSDGVDSYTCSCAAGYSGRNCQTGQQTNFVCVIYTSTTLSIILLKT